MRKRERERGRERERELVRYIVVRCIKLKYNIFAIYSNLKG